MKYLIIGLGSMGNRRARNLQELGVSSNKILGFDLSEQRRIDFSKTHSIDTASSLDEAFSQKIKAVIISTPPDTHMSFAKRALEHHLPFFTEAGTSLDGMVEVMRLADEKRVLAAPSCTLRFHPLVVRMKSLVDSGDIGRVLAFTHHCGQYLPDWHPWEDYRKFYVSKRSTGACREIVPFELNWLIWILGWPKEIMAYKDKVSDLECDIDDVYQVLLRYPDRLLGYLQVDVLARTPTRSLTILGSEGTLKWDATAKTLQIYKATTGINETFSEEKLKVKSGYSDMSPEKMYIDEMQAFVNAVDGISPFPHTFEEDIRILTILNQIEKSSDSGLRLEAYGETHTNV